jgi:hypothetical protein
LVLPFAEALYSSVPPPRTRLLAAVDEVAEGAKNKVTKGDNLKPQKWPFMSA